MRPVSGEFGMRNRVMAYPWEATSLGPRDHWSSGLVTLVDTVLSHGFPMIALLGPDLLQIYNDGYAEILAVKNATALGQPTEVCWPEVWHINGPIYGRVLKGEVVTKEDGLYPLARSGPLEDAWFTLTYSPIHDDGGAPFGVLVTMIETTRRVLAERTRDKLMERQRFMLMLSDRLREAADPETVRTFGLEAISSYFKLTDAQLISTSEMTGTREAGLLVLPVYGGGNLRAVLTAHSDQGDWCDDDLSFMGEAAERVWTALEKAEADKALREALGYQKLLLGELQHRVRNSLALINRIAERSGDNAADIEEYREAFLGRLSAFARVQTSVTESPDEGLDLHMLLVDELRAYPARQISLSGPPAMLRPRSAERMALAIHELGVNALKHGAFRHGSGELSVTWGIDDRGLAFTWRETGGPSIAEPTTRGFGSEVFESALAYDLGAMVEVSYAGGGLTCSIRLPVDNLR